MPYNHELVDRIREALEPRTPVREVKMFGGLSFMVNDKIALGVMSDGNILVRADPKRDDLLSVKGAQQAEMGAGRTMGRGWISVAEDAVTTEDELGLWIDVALAWNAADDHR